MSSDRDAAERLRVVVSLVPEYALLLDAALAAERRATVERIRAALEARHQNARAMYPLEIHAILDAEAEREAIADEKRWQDYGKPR